MAGTHKDLGTLFARMSDRHPAYRHIVERDPSGELAIACFEMLFDQNIEGVFFMMLDEPFDWRDAGKRDAHLAYAYDHLRLTAMNEVYCDQMGFARDRLLGSAPRDRWHRNPEMWRESMRALYDQGRIHHSVRAPRSQDAWVYLEGEYVCTYDERGWITGHCGMQRDITEHRTSDLALAASRERLGLAIECAEIGVWDVDVPGQRMLFEPPWATRFGYPEEPRWRSATWWGELVHPEDLPAMAETFRDHVAGLTPRVRFEYRLRTASGDYRWVQTTGKVTARDANGIGTRVVGTSIDITERKRLSAQLAASERLASLGTLAAGVGHEINNPLTYIALGLELVTRELDAIERGEPVDVDKLRGIVGEARYGTERVAAVVRDLRSLARAPDEHTDMVSPAMILPRCLQIADHQIRHRARVICDLRPTPMVACSEDRAMQLFLNLIINAAQALPVGRADHYWIRVATRTCDDGRAVIEVADNGAGIAPEDVERIYEPFFTTKRPGEGTGLGLAICRNIVDNIGGDIELDTAPDRGTTFRVRLPPARTRPIPVQRDPDPVPAPGPHPKRVLVIDDEAIIGRLVSAALDGYDVVAETSAKVAASRLAGGEHFDRILCDLMMPEVTGMDFYELIAPELRDRVVFLTGGAFTERARKFLADIPNRRLDKPFDVDALEAVLSDPR